MGTEQTTPTFHCCTAKRAEELTAGIPPDEVGRHMAETFKALSDPARVRILYLLSQDELCVHDLATMLEMGQSAVSHHLKTLRLMRLVRTRREGRSIFYALDDEHVMRLFNECRDHVEHLPD